MVEASEPSYEDTASPRGPETGEGKFIFPGGAVYEGEYVVVDGTKMRDGFGVHTDGKEKYVGQWQNDHMNGEGEMVFASGASYRGSFKGNKFQGKGCYEWNDGASYEGNWRRNKMHGHGCYVDHEKSRWEGQFYNGMFDNGRAKVALR